MSRQVYETVIGVEVHVRLRTATKMFCGCRVEFGAPPNSHVCPVCLGLPGALPVPNEQAVALGTRAALALRCEIRPESAFVRKNYFYADLPKGFQITQLEAPLAVRGRARVPLDGGSRTVRIRRLHLEEDAGKSVHDRFEGATAVDLNRAGVPLAEIVTEPDLRAPSEARAFLGRLKQILEHYASVSDCNMEEGSLRVDANVSVRPAGAENLESQAEIKNLNSFRHVERALAHERERQVRLLEAGEDLPRETRHFDAEAGVTRRLRGKEEAFDYRYFPEPDLPPLRVSRDRIERMRATLPELPGTLERRFESRHSLPAAQARYLAARPRRAAYFQAVVGERGPGFARQAAHFLTGELAEERNRRESEPLEEDLLPPAHLARVVELRRDGTLSSDTASEALRLLMEGGGEDPDEVIDRHRLAQIRDAERLGEWVREAVEAHPEEAERFASGEEKLLGFFMGAVMRRAQGKADPERARRLLRERLEGAEEAR